jgi:hypothetical protein
MRCYQVLYCTYSRVKDADGKVGNIKQFIDTAYIECKDTSDCKRLLGEYYKTPRNGIYYVPDISCISKVDGHCIIDE